VSLAAAGRSIAPTADIAIVLAALSRRVKKKTAVVPLDLTGFSPTRQGSLERAVRNSAKFFSCSWLMS
jgi:ribosomal protein S18